MMQREMTDSEVREVVERTEAFIEQIGVAVSEAIGAVDPHSPCADASRRSLARISGTLREVDYALISRRSISR